jgi:hypothetical protein
LPWFSDHEPLDWDHFLSGFTGAQVHLAIGHLS